MVYSDKGYTTYTYLGAAMTWDNAGNLASIQKGSNTTTYRYNNGLLLSQTTGTGSTAETLSYADGKPVSITYKQGSNAAVTYFYAYNGQGDVIAIYNSSNSTLVGSYEYDLWGKLISATPASSSSDPKGILMKNPFRYRGYYYDTETGYYYLNARYYDPQVRRFISADDMAYLGADGTVNTYNLFAYGDNNPIIRMDIEGHFAQAILIGFAVGIAGQYVSDVIGNIKEGKTGTDIFKPTSSAKDYLASGVGGAIAATPGLNLIGTMAVGALGNVVADGLKGNINSVSDFGESVVSGAVANGIGYGISKGLASMKVKKIQAMPRSAEKRCIKEMLPSQADVNINLHNFNQAPMSANIKLIEDSYIGFRASIYSTVSSGMMPLIKEIF